MLHRNDGVNVAVLAAAYVQGHQAQLLPTGYALAAETTQEQPSDPEPVQQDSSASGAVASSAGPAESFRVTLLTFKDLMEDLRSQLKAVNELSDKVYRLLWMLSCSVQAV